MVRDFRLTPFMQIKLQEFCDDIGKYCCRWSKNGRVGLFKPFCNRRNSKTCVVQNKKNMRYLILIVMVGASACAQKRNPETSPLVGGGCDGCDLIYEGMPPTINEVDTSAGW